MADEIIIETTSAEVIEVGVPGPQGPAGAAGAGLTTLTTAGDLLYRNNTEATRLPVGSNGQVLKVAGGLPAWANESGAVTSVNGQTGAVTVAAATHATEHEAGEADEIQAMAALVTTDDASLNGIYVPNASGTTSGGRLTLYKTGTRQNTKLEYNQSLSIWQLIKNAVVQLSGQQANATYAWTTQQWLDERSPQVLPNGGTVTRAGLEVLARRAADGTSNVATATTSEDGLLSSTDKTKLNGIAANATANTASSATPSALGTAAAGSATDYARADHVHSAEVSDSAFRVTGSTDATKKVALEVDTNVPSGQTVTLTAPSASGTLALAGAAPSAHAASHASAGSDPLFDQDLNTTDAVQFASVTTTDIFGLGALEALGTGSNFTRVLGDGGLEFGGTNAASTRTNLGLAIGTDVAAASHTHAASAITSGTLAHERGGLEADVSAYSGLVKISGGSTSAVTVTSAGEALLDDADAAAQRTTLGLGTAATAATGDFAAASHSHELTALAATGATNGHVLTANGSGGVTFAAAAGGTPADNSITNAKLSQVSTATIKGRATAGTGNVEDLTATQARGLLALATTDNVTFGSLQNTPIGSTTRSSGAFTSLSSSQGTITASSPVTIAATWNNGAAQFNALDVSISNTDSLAASTFITLRAGASGLTSMASITRSGAAFFGQGTVSIGDGANSIVLYNAGTLSFSSGGGVSANASTGDTILRRDAANTLAIYNTTNAQAFRLYSTFTSTTNFERLNIAAQTGGNFIVGTEKGSGGGTARGLELRTDNVARITIGSAGQLGFFGATAAAQPTAVADATDAATVITQLNALLSRMRTLGLIAT